MAEDRRLGLRALAHLLAHRLAAADALLGRRRPEPERGRDPGQDVVVQMPVPGQTRVRGRALPRLGRRLGAGLVPIKPRLEPPRAAQAEVVLVALEDRDRQGRRPRRFLRPALLDVEEPEELLLDAHVRRRALVVRGGASRSASSSTLPGLGQPAALDQRARRARRAAPVRRGSSVGAARKPARAGRSPRAGRCGQAPAAPPPRAARTPGRPARRRASRASRARRGTGRPARGGSRRSPRTRAAGRRPSVRARRRSARAGRRGRSSAASGRRRRGSET